MTPIKSDNKVYAWGLNEYGECGVDSDEKWIKSPTQVKNLENYKVLQLSTGFGHSLLKCKPIVN